MTNESQDPALIERDIEQDRNALRRTLNDLQDELSLDGFARRVTDKFRENGGEWANSASEAARSNPVALALTGVGLAWLIFGRGYDPTHRQVSHDVPRRRTAPDRDWDRATRSYGASGEFSDRTGGNGGSVSSASGGSDAWGGSASTETGHASGGSGGSGGTSSRDQHDSMTDRLRRKAHDWRDSVSDSSSQLHDRLSAGTEDLSDEARRRVTEARRQALEARDAAARKLRAGSRTVSDGYDREPLLFGAAALAVGAGLACLLPRTRQEDELLGSYSDRLFHEAESIFEEEKAKVQGVVSAGLSEAKSAAAQVTSTVKDELGKNLDNNSGSGGSGGSGTSGSSTSSGTSSGTSGADAGSGTSVASSYSADRPGSSL
ncbi:DUF3618 domain-containing protein [Paracoccus tibetensis]|uniref:DUF3618 domain-containing protein n=1 Tax=Paracoccus tibetensis TaxID=336292 RepID=A0A1G5BAB3_9RHOB|nr:DUF3618 domain-containing protein [Paracoccus tibetensis]SCX87036.1 Protein of unknown function [Paracoccus tibetensis]